MLFLAYFFAFPLVVSAQEEGAATFSSQRSVDFSGMHTVTREFEKTAPTSESPEIHVETRYGNIELRTWENSVVRVAAQITVGGNNRSIAEEVALDIGISVKVVSDRFDIRTLFPGAGQTGGTGYVVDYLIHVPRGATVFAENAFGDTLIEGLEGRATIDSRYGMVKLLNLSAPVRVRSRGEFPVIADGLAQGGTFLLRQSQAYFSKISGKLAVTNYLGSVELRSTGTQADIALTSESGPILVYLTKEFTPEVDAWVEYGELSSQLPLVREEWGPTMYGRHQNPGAAQRLELHASFGNIDVVIDGQKEPKSAPAGFSEIVQDEISQQFSLPSGRSLSDDAIVGDVHIEGGDGDRVRIVAKRSVHVASLDLARLALESLTLRVEEQGDGFRIVSSVQENMDALGSLEYRTDLFVTCPRWASLKVNAENGETMISNLDGDLVVEQGLGTLEVSESKGSISATNHKGNVTITEALGSVFAETSDGIVTLDHVRGDSNVHAVRGKIVVDTPGAGLILRGSDGDVRIIALEGVKGDYDVLVNNGSINIAAPESADATFWLNTSRGTIRSSIPMTGTMEQDIYHFQGRLNNGTYRVLLVSHDGNVVLD